MENNKWGQAPPHSKIFTSHCYSKMGYLLATLTNFVVLLFIIMFVNLIFIYATDVVRVIAALLGLIFATFLSRRFVRPFFHQVSTFCYIRFNLGVDIAFTEARQFVPVFESCLLSRWYPLEHIKILPKDQRKAALYIETERVFSHSSSENSRPSNSRWGRG